VTDAYVVLTLNAAGLGSNQIVAGSSDVIEYHAVCAAGTGTTWTNTSAGTNVNSKFRPKV
jgi:hypothetical protein